MLTIADINRIDEQLSIAVFGMEEALHCIPNCQRNYASMIEGYNINRGVYIGIMDFLDNNYPAIANEMRDKYGDSYEALGEKAGKLYQAVFLKCK